MLIVRNNYTVILVQLLVDFGCVFFFNPSSLFLIIVVSCFKFTSCSVICGHCLFYWEFWFWCRHLQVTASCIENKTFKLLFCHCWSFETLTLMIYYTSMFHLVIVSSFCQLKRKLHVRILEYSSKTWLDGISSTVSQLLRASSISLVDRPHMKYPLMF